MLTRIVLVSILAFGYALVPEPVAAGEIAMGDGNNAKLARIKAKRIRRGEGGQKFDSATQGPDGESDDGGCGNVSVGNTVVQRGAKGPREQITIITGDVINANNDCK